MYYVKQDLAQGEVNRRVIADPFFCSQCGLPAVSHLANYEPVPDVVQDQYRDISSGELIGDGAPEVAQVSSISRTKGRLAASASVLDPAIHANPCADTTSAIATVLRRGFLEQSPRTPQPGATGTSGRLGRSRSWSV